MGISQSLSGHRALICGASVGIGRATAITLAEQGADCIILARRLEQLQAVKHEIESIGGTASIIVGDLDQREEVLKNITTELQQGPISILINNTGGPKSGPLIETSEEALLHAFSRHVLSAHRLTQILLPGMIANDYGRIINVLSTSVYEPIPNLGVSNTTRGAMASWAKSIAKELPPRITINNVLPGFTDTERLHTLQKNRANNTGTSIDAIQEAWLSAVPEGRFATAMEIAATIAFLASPAAEYIRGVSLPVDGGRLKSI